MGAYPTTPRAAFLEWCQADMGVFSANATQIGLAPAQATAFSTATSAVAAALLAQEQAHQAALLATQVATDALGTLRSSAGDTVRLIRAFAESTAKPATVYNFAQIPPPASPSPAPPTAQPTELTVTLNASDGGLMLRWKASNPAGTSGTSYIIRRKLPQDGEFSFIGVSVKKEFLDDTLSFGPGVREGIHAPAVQYTVQGQRANSSGPLSPIFTVNFGRLPGGGMTASVAAMDHRLETGATASTVDGQPVRKVLPTGNGRPARAKSMG